MTIAHGLQIAKGIPLYERSCNLQSRFLNRLHPHPVDMTILTIRFANFPLLSHARIPRSGMYYNMNLSRKLIYPLDFSLETVSTFSPLLARSHIPAGHCGRWSDGSRMSRPRRPQSKHQPGGPTSSRRSFSRCSSRNHWLRKAPARRRSVSCAPETRTLD
jgi:hypothetical protein